MTEHEYKKFCMDHKGSFIKYQNRMQGQIAVFVSLYSEYRLGIIGRKVIEARDCGMFVLRGDGKLQYLAGSVSLFDEVGLCRIKNYFAPHYFRGDMKTFNEFVKNATYKR